MADEFVPKAHRIDDAVLILSKAANAVRNQFKDDLSAMSLDADVVRVLFDSIDAVKFSQPPMRTTPASSGDWNKFGLWTEANKIDLAACGLEVKQVEEGHGLVATREIKKGEKMLAVPVTAMMTTKLARSSKISELIEVDRTIMSSPSVQLTMYVVHEMHKDLGDTPSFFRPYLRTLPKAFDLPLFWSVEELKKLDCSPILGDIMKLIITTCLEYTFLCTIIQNTPKCGIRRSRFTLEQYQWAKACVLSRQNAVPIDGQMELALIPVWDLMNHVDGEIASFFDPASSSLECKSIGDFQSGDQVYMSYGQRPNCELLIYQGFVDANNPHTCMDLPRIRVDTTDEFASGKQAFLDSNASPNGCYIFPNGTISPELRASLRIVACTGDEWKQLDKSSWPNIPDMSARSESGVCSRMMAICNSLLEDYPEISVRRLQLCLLFADLCTFFPPTSQALFIFTLDAGWYGSWDWLNAN
eukprot:TRINITY_DN2396_c0_g1_i2.p1 TRINITY_DN2396_c0_g1~~TRINITY_DN2396_c0_g1_i2.p1  ORF type:complete len:471 (-),score=121.92 TRINITY_DN2396_c0_g1_i2:36-1448(-)